MWLTLLKTRWQARQRARATQRRERLLLSHWRAGRLPQRLSLLPLELLANHYCLADTKAVAKPTPAFPWIRRSIKNVCVLVMLSVNVLPGAVSVTSRLRRYCRQLWAACRNQRRVIWARLRPPLVRLRRKFFLWLACRVVRLLRLWVGWQRM